MGSASNIAFRKREGVDEIYTFPIEVNDATLDIRSSEVMVEYQHDGKVLVIAADLPGMSHYFDNYPDVEDEKKNKEHEFANELLKEAKGMVKEYSPETSTATTHSGNRVMKDLYFTVDEDQRDKAVLNMWQMLNHMKQRYIDFLETLEDEEYLDFPNLESEIVEISKKLDCE